jgi:hypothetical protein
LLSHTATLTDEWCSHPRPVDNGLRASARSDQRRTGSIRCESEVTSAPDSALRAAPARTERRDGTTAFQHELATRNGTSGALSDAQLESALHTNERSLG